MPSSSIPARTWGPRARLAWDTVALRPTRGIPTWIVYTMDTEFMEQTTGHAPGDYRRDPEKVYLAFQEFSGCCFIDQYIPLNPLSMGPAGYEGEPGKQATQGAERIVVDGIEIDSPEAVVEHMERFIFPALEKEIAETDPADPAAIAALVQQEHDVQRRFGDNLLKGMYGAPFPRFRYGTYGYEGYFMAYAAYPEVIERDFALQAQVHEKVNRQRAAAIAAGGLPPVLRLDHDMADSRGTLVDVRSLDRLWFPQFRRAIEPLLKAGVRLLWHCDGNLMQMVPRLLECGIGGFQGFQYEDGMDYPAICRMKTRDGDDLLIYAGVSVTRTLPFGTRQDVIDQLKWLVDHGPKRGLFLSVSSSITPNTNRENILTLIEGLRHYRQHGRGD